MGPAEDKVEGPMEEDGEGDIDGDGIPDSKDEEPRVADKEEEERIDIKIEYPKRGEEAGKTGVAIHTLPLTDN